jgi:hypothetical protein
LIYEPRPINTSHVTLTPDILQLTERLAENAHDLWAVKRLAEGWTYGPEKRWECTKARGLRDAAAVKIAQGTRRVPRPTSKGAT